MLYVEKLFASLRYVVHIHTYMYIWRHVGFMGFSQPVHNPRSVDDDGRAVPAAYDIPSNYVPWMWDMDVQFQAL